MHARSISLFLWGALVGAGAHAADGLVAPAPEALWLGLHARVSLQATALSPLSLSALAASRPRSLQAGAVLGDYYFSSPGFGHFRATSGLLIGPASASLLSAPSGPRLGLAANSAPLPLPAPLNGDNGIGAAPYFGLGFSSFAPSAGLSFSADLGLVAENNGRALFGTQGADNARRDLRLLPMLQLGMRYVF